MQHSAKHGGAEAQCVRAVRSASARRASPVLWALQALHPQHGHDGHDQAGYPPLGGWHEARRKAKQATPQSDLSILKQRGLAGRLPWEPASRAKAQSSTACRTPFQSLLISHSRLRQPGFCTRSMPSTNVNAQVNGEKSSNTVVDVMTP